jgi:hypothetical protein
MRSLSLRRRWYDPNKFSYSLAGEGLMLDDLSVIVLDNIDTLVESTYESPISGRRG